MLLTIKQFSTEYKIPLYTCYQHIEDGLLPADKYGSVYLIDSDRIGEYKQNLLILEKRKLETGGRPTSFTSSLKEDSLSKQESNLRYIPGVRQSGRPRMKKTSFEDLLVKWFNYTYEEFFCKVEPVKTENSFLFNIYKKVNNKKLKSSPCLIKILLRKVFKTEHDKYTMGQQRELINQEMKKLEKPENK